MHVPFPRFSPQARATYHRYMHPKEAFISHGILNPEITRMKDAASLSRRGAKPGSSGGQRLGSVSSNHSGGGGGGSANDSITAIGSDDAATLSGDGARGGLTFVYPYGATMTVQSPAHPVLSSGPISYPLNRPVAGVWERPADVPPGGKGSGDGAGGRRDSGSSGRGVMAARAPRPEDHEGERVGVALGRAGWAGLRLFFEGIAGIFKGRVVGAARVAVIGRLSSRPSAYSSMECR